MKHGTWRPGRLFFAPLIIGFLLLAGVSACGGSGSSSSSSSSSGSGSGSDEAVVSAVVGDTVAQAATTLEAAGLSLGTQTVTSSVSVPSGQILSQNPVAGTRVAEGSSVTVVVSSGPPTVSVPSLSGDTVAQATSALQAAGLTLGGQSIAASSSVPSGEVVTQNPASGTQAAAGSAVAIVVSSGASLVTVPSVVGDTVAQASSTLQLVGLSLVIQITTSSTTSPSGTIISQNPGAGTSVPNGTSVAMVVSSGPPPLTVPSLVDATVAQAAAELQAVSLTLGTQTAAASTTIPSGQIISQNPVAGTVVATGAAVAVVVSSGPPPVTVPNLITDSIAQATTVLQAAGLSLGAHTTATSASVPSGQIISQNPAAGASVASGTSVAVVVSSGPPPVTVPSVLNDTVAQATSALQSTGLTLGTQTSAGSTSVPSGEILSQNPTAGASVASGTSVAVVVSSGPPPVTVPSVLNDTVAQATSALQSTGLTLGTQTSAGSTSVPSGEIVGQNPAAGTSVASGTAVAVTVSFGPPVTVPSLIDDTVAQATATLQAAGLTLGSQASASSGAAPDGEIANQSPAAGTAVASGAAVAVVVSSGVSFATLYHFVPFTTDGSFPYAGVIQGKDGNFYGTTSTGGAGGCGTVYKLTPTGVETVWYSFGGGSDGAAPLGALIQANDGNFYGTTSAGGTSGKGTVFRITPAGVETVLYSFVGGDDGETPEAALVQAGDGNFYSTTSSGGSNDVGTVFKLTPAGVKTVLYSFSSAGGARGPGDSGLIIGNDGNFYGTTAVGNFSNGSIFRITPAGAESVLYSFPGGGGGSDPTGVIQATDGNFYGTTGLGGANNLGTVFKVTPAGVGTILYSFAGGLGDGAAPGAGVVQGSDGNFYGTTGQGGTSDYGTIFMVAPAGAETLLYSFTGGADGDSPSSLLIQASDGNFYGTTQSSNSAGTVFEF